MDPAKIGNSDGLSALWTELGELRTRISWIALLLNQVFWLTAGMGIESEHLWALVRERDKLQRRECLVLLVLELLSAGLRLTNRGSFLLLKWRVLVFLLILSNTCFLLAFLVVLRLRLLAALVVVISWRGLTLVLVPSSFLMVLGHLP